MNHKIPVTVAVLTHNSAATLPRALESVKDFAEIIICDGWSIDGTCAIADMFGARIIQQDKQFLAGNGRIQNFAGVRNQALTAATNDWFFFLDSDEYIGLELAKEILEKTTGKPSAYWIPRRYVYQGEVIDCSVAYPSQQMRFFHRAVVREFIKKVHEKIELRPDIIPKWLTEPMFVPVPDTTKEMIAKWHGYLVIENAHRSPLSIRQWIPAVLKDVGIAVLYLIRLLRIMVFCRGTRLPVSYELARVWYQCALIKDSFRMIKKK
jgi:glycosyltransferase involved in cell wall biosynthesis